MPATTMHEIALPAAEVVAIRKALGLTQTGLAEAWGISKPTVIRIEKVGCNLQERDAVIGLLFRLMRLDLIAKHFPTVHAR
jgi:predicted transcriptional regulator